MLKVSFKDYLESFAATLGNQETDELDDTTIRIALVMCSMLYSKEDTITVNKEIFCQWTPEDFDNYENWTPECLELQDKCNKFMQTYIENKNKIPPEMIIKNPLMIFCEQSILNEIIKYLLSCK